MRYADGGGMNAQRKEVTMRTARLRFFVFRDSYTKRWEIKFIIYGRFVPGGGPGST